MLDVYIFYCQEPVGVYDMYARHSNRHKSTSVVIVVVVTIVVVIVIYYDLFASYYANVYHERTQSEGLY
jgi:hypothetical protein